MSDMEFHPALVEAMKDRPQKQPNPNIYERHDIEPEIYRDLFAPLLENSVFERWQDQRAFFHLRYVGGPGSGKTTFAAIAAQSLRTRYKPSGKDLVVSIFISTKVRWDENALAGVLESLFLQLCLKWAPEPSSACLNSYAAFLQRSGELSTRLKDLRAAIDCRVGEIDRVFLVVDGLDHSRPENALHINNTDFETDLEKELAGFDSKVKVLSTSRVLNPEKDEFIRQWWPSGSVICDSDECSSPESETLRSSVYWACQEECDYTLCWPCYEQGGACTEWYVKLRFCSRLICEADIAPRLASNTQVNFRQTSNVCIDMNSVLGPRVSQYIEQEIQHQDDQANFRGTVSGEAGMKKRFRNKKDNKFLSPITISDMSGNNIAIARIRLELTYFGRGNPAVDEGLPREVVNVFNSIVDATCDLGVKAIAAVDSLTSNDDPVSLKKVNKSLDLDDENSYTRVLLAAKGLIIATRSPLPPNPLFLRFYNSVFKRYVSDGYNQRIIKTKERMRATLEMVAQEPEESPVCEYAGYDSDYSEDE